MEMYLYNRKASSSFFGHRTFVPASQSKMLICPVFGSFFENKKSPAPGLKNKKKLCWWWWGMRWWWRSCQRGAQTLFGGSPWQRSKPVDRQVRESQSASRDVRAPVYLLCLSPPLIHQRPELDNWREAIETKKTTLNRFRLSSTLSTILTISIAEFFFQIKTGLFSLETSLVHKDVGQTAKKMRWRRRKKFLEIFQRATHTGDIPFVVYHDDRQRFFSTWTFFFSMFYITCAQKKIPKSSCYSIKVLTIYRTVFVCVCTRVNQPSVMIIRGSGREKKELKFLVDKKLELQIRRRLREKRDKVNDNDIMRGERPGAAG